MIRATGEANRAHKRPPRSVRKAIDVAMLRQREEKKKNPAIGKTKETEEAAKDDTHTKAREARTIVSGSSCSTVAVFDAGDRS